MIIPVGFAQCNVVFSGAGVPTGAQVTFGVKNDAAHGAAELGSYVIQYWDESDIMVYLSNTVQIDGVLVKLGPNDTGPSDFYASVLVGGGASAANAPNAAFLIHKSTALGGRQSRGRMYIPGLQEADINTGGLLAGTTAADMGAACQLFLEKMAADSLPLALLHGNAVVPFPIDAMSCDAKVATQRRRLRR